MVSAGNLNLDVLELISGYLDQHDLFNFCLVSQNFVAAATPILYHSIGYHFSPSSNAALKRSSAFDTILLHPTLAGHIRHIHITLPIVSPEQVQNCRTVLGLRANTGLDSFVCTPSEVKNFVDVLPTLSSIGYLKANVQLLEEKDLPLLFQVRGLRSITLEFAPWQLIHALPKWAADHLGSTLKNLTLYSCFGLTEERIRAAIAHLPNLTGLHIRTCRSFDFPNVLSIVPFVPSLKELSFSIWDLTGARRNLQPFSLPNLEELVVDLLGIAKPFPLESFLSVFTLFEDAPLKSLGIYGRSQMMPAFPLASYELLINRHAKTLRRVILVKASIPTPAIHSICKTCKKLEILGVPVPSAADLVCDLRWLIEDLARMIPRDDPAFIQALRQSDTLHTLVHVPKGTPGGNLFSHPIDRTSVTHIMTSTRRLRRIENENQIWLGKLSADLKFELVTKRRRWGGFIGTWYMPPETL